MLSADHAVCRAPDQGCERSVAADRPITGQATTLPILKRHGKSWLQVRLPGRTHSDPNPPATGWIKAQNTSLSHRAFSLTVSRGKRRLTVLRNGHRVRGFRVIVGKPSTPTPSGKYFIEETVALSGGAPGAPYALALSARSSVLQEFEGGPGQIAIHGVRNIGGRLGTAVSHGCIRTSTRADKWLASHLEPGVLVTIR